MLYCLWERSLPTAARLWHQPANIVSILSPLGLLALPHPPGLWMPDKASSLTCRRRQRYKASILSPGGGRHWGCAPADTGAGRLHFRSAWESVYGAPACHSSGWAHNGYLCVDSTGWRAPAWDEFLLGNSGVWGPGPYHGCRGSRACNAPDGLAERCLCLKHCWYPE